MDGADGTDGFMVLKLPVFAVVDSAGGRLGGA